MMPFLLRVSSKTPASDPPRLSVMLLEEAQPLPCRAAEQEASSGPEAKRLLSSSGSRLLMKNEVGFVSALPSARSEDSSVAVPE